MRISLWRAGRAGLLGLAISLVSTVPERVWFVKAKGYKPWLNPKPQDTKHHDEGGHTIWYNEPELLQVVTASVQWPKLLLFQYPLHTGSFRAIA